MVFMEYEYRDDFWHNLKPLPNLAFQLCVTLIIMIWTDPRYLIGMIIVSILVAVQAKYPKEWLFAVWITLATALVSSLITLPFSNRDPAWFKVYPTDLILIRILQITPPGTPLVGEILITVGTLLYWLGTLLKIIPLLLFWSVFFWTSNPVELMQTAANFKLPIKVLYVVEAAYYFVPSMTRRIETIINAQKLRGWTTSSNNPFTMIEKYAPLTRPLTSFLLAEVNDVAITAETRAMGATKYVAYKRLRYSITDISFTVISILLLGLAVYLQQDFSILRPWLPYAGML